MMATPHYQATATATAPCVRAPAKKSSRKSGTEFPIWQPTRRSDDSRLWPAAILANC